MSDYGDKQARYLWLEHDKMDTMGTQVIRIYFRYFTENDNRPVRFNADYADTQGGGYDFESLMIRAQYSTRDDSLRDNGLYGWSTEYYQRYFIDLDEARMMVKTLNRIETGMSRLRDKWGPPQTFSQYVIRIANLFQVEGLLRKVSGKEAMMIGRDYAMHDLVDTGYAIGLLLNEYGMFDKERIPNV